MSLDQTIIILRPSSMWCRLGSRDARTLGGLGSFTPTCCAALDIERAGVRQAAAQHSVARGECLYHRHSVRRSVTRIGGTETFLLFAVYRSS
eukprot:CAMPEP_0181382648 /NCGR_PEP_ID=MMETSP1106-20121128/20870_1 /TAXON_ID=81844 /ORGANISM="Mantoniella antarctica, Strain SL-175" /LENGTH=91 /DNA_ID=CAMNT_0023502119 /DNA_START=22 /DNA_END=294 /DNA_ORIENTATION=-